MYRKIESVRGITFISKEYKHFSSEYTIIREYGTPNLHTGTGFVERTIQSLKKLIQANLEEVQNLCESFIKALYFLRFTTHAETKKTHFELHIGRKPRTKLSNPKNASSVDSIDLSVYIARNSAGELINHLVMSKKKINDPKYRRGLTFTQNRKPSNTVSNYKNFNYPFIFFEKAQTKSSLGRKINRRLQSLEPNIQSPPTKTKLHTGNKYLTQYHPRTQPHQRRESTQDS